MGSDSVQAVHNSLATTHAANTTFDPMAMEIDNIGNPMASLLQTIANLATQVNNMQMNNLQRRRPNRLTPEERDKLMSVNGCFRCRKHHAGHVASNCLSYPTTSGRTAHNVSIANEGGPQPGNAPGN